MIKIEVHIDIKHPAKETFRYLSHFENNPIWQDGMDSCLYTTELPQRIGTRYQQKAHFLGKEIVSEFEVLQYEADSLVKATTISGSFPITFTRMVEGDEQQCHVHAIIEGESKGFFRIAQPLMRWMVNRSIQKDYKKLKRILEEL